MENEIVVIKKEREEKENNESKEKKKKSKEEKNEKKQENKNGQDKFFVDVSKDAESKDQISKLLAEANNKSLGREIVFKDIAIAGIAKLTNRDIEKIQDNALSDMERVERLLVEHNEKFKSNLTMGEFLVKRLNILKEDKLGK
jgi:hypothetical protein